MAKTLSDSVQDLKDKGLKPCPNCGAYFNPDDPKMKENCHCANCGADLTKPADETTSVRMSEEELSSKLQSHTGKAKLTKTISLACVVGMFVLWWAVHPIAGVVSAIAAFVLFAISSKESNKAKTLLANNITRDIVSQIFDECIYASNHRLPNSLLREADLITSWDDAMGSDLVSGRYKGHAINFSDITLTEEVEQTDAEGNTTTTNVTKFRGQWLILELGREVPAKLRLRENAERTGKFSKAILGDRKILKGDVQVESEEFNKRFQILTEDAHSAFYILTPHFIEFILKADVRQKFLKSFNPAFVILRSIYRRPDVCITPT